MAAITLERITKLYDGAVVGVRDLDLHIEDGEFLVLVGASGSGKSTALRVIAGLERVTAGCIRIGARDVTDVPPQDRDLAMVFQSYALYPHLTVRENLGFGLEMRRVPRPELKRRVEDVARALDLEPLLARRPAALSGGQRQRVALGRAIIREPQAFLLDEPLSNLDAQLRVQTRAELVSLHRRLGATMLYVTHDQVEAMTMGQRVALLHAGTLQQVGPPLALYDTPANRVVAAAIGSPPMNFLRGRLETDGDARAFRSPALSITIGGGGQRDADPQTPPEVELGIRPEHLVPCPEAEADLLCTTLVVEPLGPETLLHARTADGTTLVARVPGRAAARPDEVLPLRLERAHVHLFDAVSGRRRP